MDGTFEPAYSSNSIWYDDNIYKCLTTQIEEIENDISCKANTDHNHIEYALKSDSNNFAGEQKFTNPQYCPNVVDSANGIGCAFKASRGLFNEMLIDKIYMTPLTEQIPIYSFSAISNGSPDNITKVGYIDGNGNASLIGNISANNLVDTVVEQGTQGNFTYRKWQSGISEAWYSEYFGNVSLTTSMAGGVWSNELYYARSVNLPSGVFANVPVVTCNACGNGYVCSHVSNVSANLIIYRIWSPYSANINGCSISIHATGRWK